MTDIEKDLDLYQAVLSPSRVTGGAETMRRR